MNLKIRSALLFGLIVTVLLSIAFSIIYIQSAWFRKDEFELRLKQRGETTYKLFAENKLVDPALLQLFDRSTFNRTYNVQIFDKDNKIMYSSSGERKLSPSAALFNKIHRKKYFVFSEGEIEAVGMLINNAEGERVIVSSGYDMFGKRKLSNLFFILSVCWLGGILITGILSYIYVRKIFKPLDVLNKNIQEVTEGNLKQRIAAGSANDELTRMAHNFNKMLDQLQQSFEVQKNFLQHASHELRTPLSNLLLQTEAALDKELTNEQYREALLMIYDDQKFLIDMVNGILSLSKYEQLEMTGTMQSFRVDELLFEVTEEIQTYHPEFNIHIDFSEIHVLENEIMVSGVPSLMKIVFTNMIRNGCIYSANNSVRISIKTIDSQILVNFFNDGPVILPEERNKLFMPFFRGSNVAQKRGHGLGLSISKRILDVHKGQLFYTTTPDGLNCFTVMLFNF